MADDGVGGLIEKIDVWEIDACEIQHLSCADGKVRLPVECKGSGRSQGEWCGGLWGGFCDEGGVASCTRECNFWLAVLFATHDIETAVFFLRSINLEFFRDVGVGEGSRAVGVLITLATEKGILRKKFIYRERSGDNQTSGKR